METTFYININLKTANDFLPFAKFYIGNDRDAALAIFRKLKGSREVSEKNVLQLDFIETVENLPVNLNVIGCTLAELSENTGIITREVFKLFSM